MEVAPRKIMIVGCGPGSADYVTDAARHAVADAEVLVGSRRLLELFAERAGERVVVGADVAALLEAIALRRAAGRRLAVLVSGDPGVHSLATAVLRRFGREQCEVIPGISSVQVAFARLGLDWADARIVSLHAERPDVAIEELSGLDKIALLAGRRDALRWAAKAAACLEVTHEAVLCENLTLPDERIRRVELKSPAENVASSLSIILLVRKVLLP